MAFCKRIRSPLRQGAAQSRQESMLNYIHMISRTRIFVGGLSCGVDDHALRNAFASCGKVVEARVISDRDTGRSWGYGFVNFTSERSASFALLRMDGQNLNGQKIRVFLANERPPGPRSSGYGGGGGFRRGGSDGPRSSDHLDLF